MVGDARLGQFGDDRVAEIMEPQARQSGGVAQRTKLIRAFNQGWVGCCHLRRWVC